MGRRNGSGSFIETHGRTARGSGVKVTTYEVHVPSTLTVSKTPLSAKVVAQSERYGEGFIEVTPYNSYPSPKRPGAGSRMPQEELLEMVGPRVAGEGIEGSESQGEAQAEESPDRASASSPTGNTEVVDAGSGSKGEHAYPGQGHPSVLDKGVVISPKPKRQALSTGNGKPFEKGNKAAMAKKPRLVMLGIPLDRIDIQDQELMSYLRKAEYYLKRRSRELCAMFGYTSAGVNGVLSSAALQLAHSKYLSVKATEAGLNNTGENILRNGDYLKYMTLSTTLQNAARSNELAAYELCAKEAGVAKTQHSKAAEWLRQGDT